MQKQSQAGALLRLGVLMGGRSIEKEVSFNSGRTVCDHIDTKAYEIVPLFERFDGKLFVLPWRFLHRGKISDFEHRLDQEAQSCDWDDLKNRVDFVYIAQHGRYGEDGRVQGMLEVLGIPYVGSKVFASALGMNKIAQKIFLKSVGIDVPLDIVIAAEDIASLTAHDIVTRLASAHISFPVVVKPNQEGSSLGISVVHDQETLIAAVQRAACATPGLMQGVLIEERVVGMEFTCVTITDYRQGQFFSLPPTEIVYEVGKEFYDYEQKYMPGRALRFTPARCSDEVTEKIYATCQKVMQALGITNLSRIDGMVTTDGRVVIFDPNTLCGMAPSAFVFKQAAQVGMNHTQLTNHFIETEVYQTPLLNQLKAEQDARQLQDQQKKIKVAVLMGGSSNEREISLESGRNVVYKLSPHKYEVIPLFLALSGQLYRMDAKMLVCSTTQEVAQHLEPGLHIKWSDLPQLVDFVFIGLHGGHGENGDVQGTLEMLGLPYNGSSVLTSALCMHKFKTNQLLRAHKIAVPDSMLITVTKWATAKENVLNEIANAFKFPIIVKPSDDGCSVYVAKIMAIQDVATHVEAMFAHGKTEALVEELIVGMELTIGVLGNENPLVLPPSESVAAAGVLSMEEKFLPGAGENQTPARLTSAATKFVQQQVKKAYEVLGCKGYARIDCFYQTAQQNPTGQERCVILEVNTLPALTPSTCIFHQAAEVNIKPMDFIDRIVMLGFEQHQKSDMTYEMVSKKIIKSEI